MKPILPTITPTNVQGSPDESSAHNSANTVLMADPSNPLVDSSEPVIKTTNLEDTDKYVAVKAQKTISDFANAIKLETPFSGESPVLTPQQILPCVESSSAAVSRFWRFGAPGWLYPCLITCLGRHSHLYRPEQWLEQPRAASDHYALAVTCYLLLSGRAPFMGNLYSIMHGHLKVPPPSIRFFNPLISSRVEAVILRALAKEPADRYENMLTFLLQEELNKAVEQKSGQGSLNNKELNAPTGTVGLCNNSNIPAPRMHAAMVWDSVDQQILLYGGLGANDHYLGDLCSIYLYFLAFAHLFSILLHLN